MTRKYIRIGVFSVVCCFSLVGFSLLFGNKAMVFKANGVHHLRGVRNCTATFSDLNETQLAAARKWGISPVQDREEAERRIHSLELVSGNTSYIIDSLTHSIPYLVPRAKELLEQIGENFADSLLSKDINPNRLIVTSVLRTLDDVKRLRRTNRNASANSAHTYGTTFDISYRRFDYISSDGKYQYEEASPDLLKAVLTEVLRDLRDAGRCFVKYEVKQGCFHITVR